MPVKKSTTQNSSVSKKGKKISKEQRESIKLAVDSLPGMVTTFPVQKEILAQPETPKQTAREETPILSTKKSLSSRYHNTKLEEKKRKIVWISVSLLMVIISCLWLYTFKAQVKNSGFGTGSDSTLWESAKFDYNQILKPSPEYNKPKTEPVTYEESEKIKEILAKNIIILDQNVTTSTPSTESMATSTLATSTLSTSTTTEKIVTTTKK